MTDSQDCKSLDDGLEPLVLKAGVKKIAPIDFPKYVPTSMTRHFCKFQKRWSARILRDWWRCQLTRGTHDNKSRNDCVPDFVYAALAWVFEQDVHAWPASAIRWKVRRIHYSQTKLRLITRNE